MAMKEIARDVVGKAANLALRMPISWVNILAERSTAAPNGSCSFWRAAASPPCTR